MELRHLHYFIAVAEELHFGRAAARLFIAQPPLSQQIQRLEKELGVLLFSRTKRRVELTEAGRIFLQEARQTVAQAERAVSAAQRAQRGEVGRLAVGFVGSATYSVLPAVLRRFCERCPDVELNLQERTTAQQVEAIRAHRLDVGFVRPPLYDPILATKTLLVEEFVLALPQTHRLARASVIALSEVAEDPFILYPHHLGPGLYDPVMSACQRAGFSPRVAQEATQMHTILSLVAIGLGVALVPACVLSLQWQGVVCKRLDPNAPQTTIALTWRKDNTSAALRSFLAQTTDPSQGS
ncbi:MAG: transcriptional regulator, LysR family [Chthonomonadales bacterium]|nr:transcriptional regulator, LysR family [Chthonomonadales bacterium]